MPTADELLTPAELQAVKEAIHRAERLTSGEVRVHLDEVIEEDVMDHAAYVFEELAMHRTAERNGVLLYLSVPSRKLALIGDKGIHERVGNGFWQAVLDDVLADFRKERFAAGLVAGVERIGRELSTHFPRRADDTNELPDDISIRRR